jgi:hypothetical protein
LTLPLTIALGDLKGFEHLFRHKTTKTIKAKRKVPGTKPGTFKIYGPEGIRTLDLYSAIVALSQLSYRPGNHRYDTAPHPDCQTNLNLWARAFAAKQEVSFSY